MTNGFKSIRVLVDARIAWLEFNRAPVNAFNREMVLEVREAIVATLADPQVRVLVLASAIDSYFSAGADLHVFRGMKAPEMRRLATMIIIPSSRKMTSQSIPVSSE